MFVGVMELHLAMIDNVSLKDKRSVIKRLTHRTRSTFNVGVSEVDDHDLSDRAVLGVVAVNAERRYLEGQLTAIEGFIERQALATVLEAPVVIEVF